MADDKIYDFTLLKKYQALLIENGKLKAENKKLKAQLDVFNSSRNIINAQPAILLRMIRKKYH